VDARSDVCSLGVMLYEMLTGQVPYEAETPMAVVIKHITALLPLPREVNAAIPETVERVILKALAKDPADCDQTAEGMAKALEEAVTASAHNMKERPLNVKRPSLRGWPPFCMRSPPMSDLLLLLLLYWDGLDAPVDLSAAQRAQDGLRCSLA
jgi:serine/threonine protein kinase